MYAQIPGTLCLGTGCVDLTSIGQEARPMADKIIEIGLAPVEEYYGSEVTLHYPGLYAGSTDLVCYIMAWKLLLTSNKLTVRKRKNGSKIIICKLHVRHGPRLRLRQSRLSKELSWYARLTYIIKNSKQKA